MSALGKVMVFVAGALLLAVLAMWLVRSGPMPPERAARPEAMAPVPPVTAPPVAPDQDVSRDSANDIPPWSKPTSGATSAPVQPTTLGVAAAAKADRAELKELRRQLMEIVAQGQSADPQKLDELLEKTMRTNGSSNLGGLNLEALRQNMVVATKMKTIAEAMQRRSSSGAPEDPKQLQAELVELGELQKQLRIDFMVPPTPAKPVGR